MATNFVDKTCRLCGSVDTNNIDIFENKIWKIRQKITTVFPIIVQYFFTIYCINKLF